MEILCICLVCSIGCNVSCPSVSSFSCTWSLPRFSARQSQVSSKVKRIKQVWGGERRFFWAETALGCLSKRDSWLEAFSCMELVLGRNSCGLGMVPREEIDVQGYGPRLCLVAVQVIQLIMGWEVTSPSALLLQGTCVPASPVQEPCWP